MHLSTEQGKGEEEKLKVPPMGMIVMKSWLSAIQPSLPQENLLYRQAEGLSCLIAGHLLALAK